MRLQALCLSTFLTFLIAINADQSIPSFLKFVGSYKYNGKVTLKRYYSSHRIYYKWIEAFTICKSGGMRMALIETDDELNQLAAMGNGTLFEDRVLIDIHNLTLTDPDSDGSERESCYYMQKYRGGKVEIHSQKCNLELDRFLCEQTKIVDSYDSEKDRPSDDKFDVKEKFFTHIGNFATKKYYASFELKAQSNNVPKICQSFGMRMISPKSQAEYDNLKSLLLKLNDEWHSVSIAGYRSNEKESEWVDSDGRVNYEIVWNYPEPSNNRYRGEHCIALKNVNRHNHLMEDIECDTDVQFVCELDESKTDVKIPSQIDPRFLKPLTSYETGSTKKELFVSLFDVDWIAAHLMCHTFGMELFTPSSSTEDESLRKDLINITGISDELHVGITSMGTKDAWYSVNTGKSLDFEPEWAFHNDYPSSDNCLTLRKSNEKYSYNAVTCTSIMNHFVCQKIVKGNKRGELEPTFSSKYSHMGSIY
ncbi:hypothetical protein HA402_008456 [Bradysia odoriphaga]|nr:hypothetical protein HA402_008456 [Bradysia odoriphaga]